MFKVKNRIAPKIISDIFKPILPITVEVKEI